MKLTSSFKLAAYVQWDVVAWKYYLGEQPPKRAANVYMRNSSKAKRRYLCIVEMGQKGYYEKCLLSSPFQSSPLLLWETDRGLCLSRGAPWGSPREREPGPWENVRTGWGRRVFHGQETPLWRENTPSRTSPDYHQCHFRCRKYWQKIGLFFPFN